MKHCVGVDFATKLLYEVKSLEGRLGKSIVHVLLAPIVATTQAPTELTTMTSAPCLQTLRLILLAVVCLLFPVQGFFIPYIMGLQSNNERRALFGLS